MWKNTTARFPKPLSSEDFEEETLESCDKRLFCLQTGNKPVLAGLVGRKTRDTAAVVAWLWEATDLLLRDLGLCLSQEQSLGHRVGEGDPPEEYWSPVGRSVLR